MFDLSSASLWLGVMFSLARLSGLLRGRLDGVPLERAGRREFAEFVPHHVLGHVHGDELPPVMHRDRLSDELGQNRGAARPGANDLLLVRRAQHRDLGFQVRVGKWSLLDGTSHGYLFLLFRVTIHLSVRLLLRVLKPRVGWPHGVTG